MWDPAALWTRQEERADMGPRYWEIIGARPGWRIADVGSGPGFFTLQYAALTGPTGHVHAVDPHAESLEFLRRKLDPVHHAHVTTEVLDVAQAPLPDLGFHAIFCTDVLHHVDDIDSALVHLRKSGAPLLLSEFDPSAPADIGPPVEHRIAPAALLAALQRAGWTTRAWVAMPHEHYAIVAKP